MVYFIVGFLIGLFLPAPYSEVVRNTIKAGWTKVKSAFISDLANNLNRLTLLSVVARISGTVETE